jgi:hypothetical protein
MAIFDICSIPDCGKRVIARGWCASHYRRWERHGNPLAGRKHRGEALRFYRENVLPYEDSSCLFWPFTRYGNGYARLHLDGEERLVSRLVCEAVNGIAPTPVHEAAHSCGKGHLGCVAKSHIRWATSAENKADKLVHGTLLRGEMCNWAKLTSAQVREIRSLRRAGLTQAALAAKFGVRRSAISDIDRRVKWAWLDE